MTILLNLAVRQIGRRIHQQQRRILGRPKACGWSGGQHQTRQRVVGLGRDGIGHLQVLGSPLVQIRQQRARIQSREKFGLEERRVVLSRRVHLRAEQERPKGRICDATGRNVPHRHRQLLEFFPRLWIKTRWVVLDPIVPCVAHGEAPSIVASVADNVQAQVRVLGLLPTARQYQLLVPPTVTPPTATPPIATRLQHPTPSAYTIAAPTAPTQKESDLLYIKIKICAYR